MKFLGDHRPKAVHHRYLMTGQLRDGAYCREPLQGEVWRHGEQYFCTELCIEAAPFFHGPSMKWLARLWTFVLESLDALRDDDQETIRRERELALRQKR